MIDPAADLVLSEVHVGAAPSYALQCTTIFPVRNQREGSAVPVIDEDGDVIVPRRHQQDEGADCGCASGSCGECAHLGAGNAAHGIIIEHALATSLNDVGKQVNLLACVRAWEGVGWGWASHSNRHLTLFASRSDIRAEGSCQPFSSLFAGRPCL